MRREGEKLVKRSLRASTILFVVGADAHAKIRTRQAGETLKPGVKPTSKCDALRLVTNRVIVRGMIGLGLYKVICVPSRRNLDGWQKFLWTAATWVRPPVHRYNMKINDTKSQQCNAS